MVYKITVYSCRNNPNLFSSTELMKQNLKDTEVALRQYGFKEFIKGKGDTGKPYALYYIDDTEIEFEGWDTVLFGHNFHSRMTIAIGIENCILDKNNNLIERAADALDFFRLKVIKIILTTKVKHTEY